MPKRKLTGANQTELKLVKRRQKVRKVPAPQPENAVKRFERGLQDVLRALKKGKSFERQRLAKRIITDTKALGKWEKRQAKRKNDDAASGEAAGGKNGDSIRQKIERLQREVQVLKILDLEVAARVHLANSMLRIKDVAEAPGPLAAHLRAIAELPADKNQRGDAADVHNVTSTLYNRANVREEASKAVTGVCLLLCVPIPERYHREEWTKEEQTNIKSEGFSDEEDVDIIDNVVADDDDDDDDDDDEDEDDDDKKEGGAEEEGEAGSDTDAEERALARFEARLGGLTEDEDSEDEDLETLRAKYKKALAEGPVEAGSDEDEEEEEEEEEEDEEIEEGENFYVDEFPSRKIGVASSESGSDDEDEDDENDEDEDEDEDEDADEPPRKRRATAVAAKGRPPAAGDSRFLPTLMGGYVSDGGGGGGSSDDGRRDDDDAAATRMLAQRKNRRGQRARQAIWEKKYKEQAKHVQAGGDKDKDKGKGKAGGGAKKTGWDAKRGAVGADEGPRWLRRKLAGKQTGGGSSKSAAAAGRPAKENIGTGANKIVSKKSKDDDGPLHPSWAAAKAAKEKAQTATFTGTKIVFD